MKLTPPAFFLTIANVLNMQCGVFCGSPSTTVSVTLAGCPLLAALPAALISMNAASLILRVHRIHLCSATTL